MSYKFKISIANKNNYGEQRKLSAIKYIVVHYTGNDGDSDEGNVKYFQNNIVKASAHYFVDNDSVTQSVYDDYIAWSVGGTKYGNCKQTGGGKYYGICTNKNSISVELCDVQKDGISNFSEKTLNNAVELIKLLMAKYNIDTDHIIRHFDVTGKTCPKPFIKDVEWNKFKTMLGDDKMTNEEKQAFDELKNRVAELESKLGIRYGYIDENMPEWAKTAVGKAVEKGIIKGDENGNLGLSYNDLRAIVREYRAGLYD